MDDGHWLIPTAHLEHFMLMWDKNTSTWNNLLFACWVILIDFLRSLYFFFKVIIQEYQQCVKQFGSKSISTFCWT